MASAQLLRTECPVGRPCHFRACKWGHHSTRRSGNLPGKLLRGSTSRASQDVRQPTTNNNRTAGKRQGGPVQQQSQQRNGQQQGWDAQQQGQNQVASQRRQQQPSPQPPQQQQGAQQRPGSSNGNSASSAGSGNSRRPTSGPTRHAVGPRAGQVNSSFDDAGFDDDVASDFFVANFSDASGDLSEDADWLEQEAGESTGILDRSRRSNNNSNQGLNKDWPIQSGRADSQQSQAAGQGRQRSNRDQRQQVDGGGVAARQQQQQQQQEQSPGRQLQPQGQQRQQPQQQQQQAQPYEEEEGWEQGTEDQLEQAATAADAAFLSGTTTLQAPPSPQSTPQQGKTQMRAGSAQEIGRLEDEESEDYETEQVELSKAQHIILQDGFLPQSLAASLREDFELVYSDPLKPTDRRRFQWDWWHVPDQYTLMRTQAKDFFPKHLYAPLEDALLAYGESRLGCRGISPIWMSYYVDGCSQELHCDNPHGPFAFVLSLTPWEGREFTGGETVILQPRVLSYWDSYEASTGLELKDLTTRVPPLFNRLTLFDPRFPHGVREVRGTKDPRKARLVLHGWFTEPSPFFTGPLAPEAAEEALNAAMSILFEELPELPPATGVLTVRMDVSGSSGEVSEVTFLADTLIQVPTPGEVYDPQGTRAAIQHLVKDTLMDASFPAAGGKGTGVYKAKLGGKAGAKGASGVVGDSSITLPIVFD